MIWRGLPAPPQFAKVVARRRQGGFLQLPCSLGFRLAFSATGGARLRSSQRSLCVAAKAASFNSLAHWASASLFPPLAALGFAVRKGRCASPPRRHPSTPLLTGLPPRFFRHWRRSASQFAKVVARRRQGGILQLPCSLGFRLAFSATGGARLRPPAAFEKAGENQDRA